MPVSHTLFPLYHRFSRPHIHVCVLPVSVCIGVRRGSGGGGGGGGGAQPSTWAEPEGGQGRGLGTGIRVRQVLLVSGHYSPLLRRIVPFGGYDLDPCCETSMFGCV